MSKLSRTLKKIDLTKDGDPKYTTFFYNKNDSFVYEVVSDGCMCAISIAEKCSINKSMKHSTKLPKYITKDLY